MSSAIETIRAATAQDAEAILALVNQAYRPADGVAGWTHESRLIEGARVSAAQLSELLATKDSVLLLGFSQGQLAACIFLEAQAQGAKLGLFAVHPEWQNRGLGKRMLQAAEDYARQYFNARQFMLHVVAARQELIDFYQRRGYRDAGERLAYPSTAGVGQPRQSGLQLMLLSKQAL